MISELLQKSSLFSLLHRIDIDLANQFRLKGCPFCDGPLYQANYFFWFYYRYLCHTGKGLHFYEPNMAGLHQDQAFIDPALPKALFHPGGDVHKGPPSRRFKPQFLSIAFHDNIIPLSLHRNRFSGNKQVLGGKIRVTGQIDP